MILITCLFIFLAVASIAFGVYTFGMADRRAALQRRLAEISGQRDRLDSRILRDDRKSSIGLLDRSLGGLQVIRRLERLLLQAGLSVRVSVFLLMSLSAAALCGMLANLLVHHVALAAFVALCAGLLPLFVITHRKERRIRRFDEQFPEAIDLMVGALRAGFALSGAIQLVADEAPDPVGSEFRILFEEQKLGLDVREALLNFTDRMGSTDAALFVTAVLIQRDTGGNLAEVLENISGVIRDRFRILGEIRTFTAVGRLSGFILAGLPPLVALVISMLNPNYMGIMLEHPLGSSVITVAVILQVVGFLVIRRIIDIKI
ncbi:MAG: type II secretion system F family protein [Candidatus Eiseniibacteriota bacterium]|jgi:tight adherence protein B